METNKNLQVAPPAQVPAEVAKKMEVWAGVGKLVHDTNIQLKSDAEAITNELSILPTEIAHVPVAEATLKESKKRLTELQNKRKAVTAKFDTVTSALMAHEKAVEAALPLYTQAITDLKRKEAERIAAEQARIEAEKRMRELVSVYLDREYTAKKDLCSELSQKAFEFALTTDIKPEAIEAFLKKLDSRFNAEQFTIVCQPNMNADVFAELWKQKDMPALELWKTHYTGELKRKFEHYAVHYANKEAAIEQQRKAEEAAKAEREEELQRKELSAKLETHTAVVVETAVKPLKQKYAVDEPDTETAALRIMAAFMTNFKMVRDGIRVKSMMKLSIGQMADALAWYKNQLDDKFECGVNFKVEEKL
jgi:hypothetical protein